ncbi:MAG: serine hydrolase domain-containing protein [Flavisolibacter sp.]
MKNIVIAGLLLSVLWNCQSTTKPAEIARNSDTAQVADPQPLPTLSEKEIRRYHDEVQNVLEHTLFRSRFNGGVLVAKNGTIVYEKYMGFKDLKKKDSLTANTPLQIASTSKTLTAAAILKLIGEKKLSLYDSVTKFFPQFPYPGVTIKLLLTHRSGLPNYLYYMEKSPWDRHKLASNEDVLKTLIEWHPVGTSRPNTHFHYCNTNYVLLALIIEKITGQPYPVYMKNNIFSTLGMTHTFVHSPLSPGPDDSSEVAMSYQGNGAKWPPDFSDGPYGDKNIYSTPRDLLKWDIGLYEQKILNQQMQDSAFTPYSNEKPGKRNYGFGWRMIALPNGKKIIYHNGHWHGFNSVFVRLIDEKATIIILSSRMNRNVYATGKKLYNLFGNYDGRHEENGPE